MPSVIHDVHVVVPTAAFAADLAALTEQHGFRVDAIYPADAPATAIVSAHGVRLRLESSHTGSPITVHLLCDDQAGSSTLPGGSVLEFRPFTTTYELPANAPTLTFSHDDGERGVGRAGMIYRDLIPDRWGGRFVASHISIPGGGPVPDYVHFHKVRFQMIFVKSGWVRLVYEDQGDPFVMVAGDCVLQPPEIRHRVLEASPGLEVIEVGCPALHETIADWALPLPNGVGDDGRTWAGQRFVRHVAASAASFPWRHVGWTYRDTGIGGATDGLAGARVARPHGEQNDAFGTSGASELAMLVVVSGEVVFETADGARTQMAAGSSVAIPPGLPYRLVSASPDCELLDVTLPA